MEVDKYANQLQRLWALIKSWTLIEKNIIFFDSLVATMICESVNYF